jgi:hypothetical protein
VIETTKHDANFYDERKMVSASRKYQSRAMSDCYIRL